MMNSSVLDSDDDTPVRFRDPARLATLRTTASGLVPPVPVVQPSEPVVQPPAVKPVNTYPAVAKALRRLTAAAERDSFGGMLAATYDLGYVLISIRRSERGVEASTAKKEKIDG